jgi:hypothetical protein
VLGAAAALVLTVVAHAGANDKDVPFSASFSGTVAFTSQTTVAFDGAGQATHMGRSSNAGVTTVVGPPNPAGCIPNLNTETLTAANGDRLVIQSNDLACPIGPTTLHGAGHWVVVDGTGRFAGATGSGSLDGVSSFGPGLSAGTFQFTLTGSVSY